MVGYFAARARVPSLFEITSCHLLWAQETLSLGAASQLMREVERMIAGDASGSALPPERKAGDSHPAGDSHLSTFTVTVTEGDWK
jgi:hypothetical protein